MHKLVKISFFGEEQTLYFNILRISELEKSLGTSILKVVQEKEIGVNLCCHALAIGLRHHDKQMNYVKAAKMIEDYLDNDGDFNEIVTAIVKALMVSGLFGKVNPAKLLGEETEEAGEEEKNV